MHALRPKSVDRKLRLALMMASGAALALLALAVAVLDLVTFRESLTHNLTTQADIIAESSTVALSFEQAGDATELLRALRANPQIRAACLYDSQGRLFASFASAKSVPLPSSPPRIAASRFGDHVELVRPVLLNGRKIGDIWICAGLEELHHRLTRYLVLAGLLLPVAFALAAWWGGRLQRAVTQPILDLSGCMRAISEGRDYGLRAKPRSDDEIGQLIEGFNAMLQQIQLQDAQLKADRAQLAERVEARTAELQSANRELTRFNDQLQQATARARQLAEEAKAASLAKSEFLATVSHELRTPMNGVIGFTDLLMDSPLNADQKEFARLIRVCGQAMLSLIDDLLDFSKIEAGKLQVESIPFNLHDVLEQVGEVLASRAEQKGLDLVLRFDPGLPREAIGDPSRFRQILMNLANNAIKFTERGHVLIEIGRPGHVLAHHPRLRLEPAPMDGILVVVEDTGVGIPEDKRDRIFHNFSQADSSTTRRYGGTGLGLAISKRLAGLLHGRIGFESAVGVGSSFWTHLPFAPANSESPPRTDPRFTGRALLVDMPGPRFEAASEHLRALGFQVEGAHGGTEALRVLHQAAGNWDSAFRWVLVDSSAVGDEREFGREVRRVPGHDRTFLLRVTPFTAREAAGKVDELPCYDATLTHPLVRPTAFRAALEIALTRRSEASGGGREPAARPPEESAPVSMQAAPVPAADPPVDSQKDAPRILLAEDNATNQLYARKLLERMGYAVDLASNGREAVAKFRSRSYALILMDCQMPELSGYDATAEIRRLERAAGPSMRRIPVVALTANALAGERERCMAAGMDEHLSKPFRRDELARVLDRWITDPGFSE